MVLEDPGQPAGDIGTRRTTRVEDAPQLRTSSAYGSHPGLRPGLEHAPTGHGRLNTLLASVEVPTTRCAPTELPLQIEAVPALPQRSRPDLRRRPVRRGLRAGHRINAEATSGSAGAGEGARHRRARVPTAEARVGAKGRTERRVRARLCRGYQSHEVIALSATGQLGMAVTGQIQLSVVTRERHLRR